jgi:hypothetical protein
VGKLPLSADQQAATLRTAQLAGSNGGLGSLRDDGAGVGDAVARAFGSGLRTAYLVAAAFALLTLIVGLVTFRRSDGPDREPDGPDRHSGSPDLG